MSLELLIAEILADPLIAGHRLHRRAQVLPVRIDLLLADPGPPLDRTARRDRLTRGRGLGGEIPGRPGTAAGERPARVRLGLTFVMVPRIADRQPEPLSVPATGPCRCWIT